MRAKGVTHHRNRAVTEARPVDGDGPPLGGEAKQVAESSIRITVSRLVHRLYDPNGVRDGEAAHRR